MKFRFRLHSALLNLMLQKEIFRSETTSNVLPVCREIVGKVKEKKSTDLIACISHPSFLFIFLLSSL